MLPDSLCKRNKLYKHIQNEKCTLYPVRINGFAFKKLSKKLEDGKENALKARELVTLLDDVDVADLHPEFIDSNKLFGVENLRWKGPTIEGKDFFNEMNFGFMYQDFRYLVS